MRALLQRLQVRHSAITVDPGTGGLRAAQLCAAGGRVRLRDALSLAVGGCDAADDEWVQRLARLGEQGDFHGSEMALVLSPPQVRFVPLRLPDAIWDQPAERIEQAVLWELARETRSEPGEFEARWWRLPAGSRGGVNVIAGCMPAEQARGWFDGLGRHGIRLVRIDAAPLALTRLALARWSPQPDDLWLIVDLGSRAAHVTVLVGTIPVYIRSVNAASHQMTTAIARAFESDPDEAEQLKRRCGICAPDQTPEQPESRRQLARTLFDVLRQPLETLVNEIEVCSAYALRIYPDLHVRRLLLAGGGASMPGLPGFLRWRLGVEVERLSPPDVFDVPEPLRKCIDSPAAAAVCGAALRDLESR